MTMETDEQRNLDFKGRLRAAYGYAADNLAFPLVTASLALGWLAWRVFFHFSEWIWAQRFEVDLETVNPWLRYQLTDPDGAEPQVLLGLVIVASVLLGALALVLPRVSQRVRVLVTLVSSCGALLLFQSAGFNMPLPDVTFKTTRWLALVLIAIAGGLVLGWARAFRRPWSLATALLLIPIAFVPAAAPSAGDAMAILSPALRLLHGVPPAKVFLQYDYLSAVVAQGWLWLGGDPMGIFLAASVSYYIMLISLPVLGRRWFSHPGLAGPLLMAVILTRIYAVMGDPITVPQIAPFRLDLWLLPVAAALYLGVRHWAVAVALGFLCISSRSMGVLYLGGYALAFPADFLAVRFGLNPADRPPWRQELRGFLRSAAPNAGIIIASLLLATLLLGSPISDAAIMYHKLGVNQLKMPQSTFYWWLLPLTALSGGLAFWKRAERGETKGGAMLLTVALLMSGSIYFFGRSHDNNLTNLSVHFLLCFFLSFDILLAEFERGGRSSLVVQVVLSSALLGLCAYEYSGRIWQKVAAQVSVLSRSEQSESLVFTHFSPMYCEEVAQSAPDGKVYFFNGLDFFYYHRCGYVPPSYMQPMAFSILKTALVAELEDLLDRGYTIALTKGDSLTPIFNEDFAVELERNRTLLRTESSHYSFITRGPDPIKPARHRRRPAHGTPAE